MPPLASTTYILQLEDDINKGTSSTGANSRLFNECLTALERVGIRTDYDLLLQSDVLEQTPAVLHPHIRTLRFAVLDHFASTGITAAERLQRIDTAQGPLRSGIAPLDGLLDGGVLAGDIVEVCSKDNAICTRVAVEFSAEYAALGDQQRPVGRVFILTSSPLPLCTLEASLKRRMGDCSDSVREQKLRQAMERIFVADCRDLDTLLGFLYHYIDTNAVDIAGEPEMGVPDLLIIDSIRPLIIDAIQKYGKGSARDHSVKVALRHITSSQRQQSPAAVLITNGISFWNGGAASDSNGISSTPEWGPSQARPSLGIAWAGVSHVQVHVFAEMALASEDIHMGNISELADQPMGWQNGRTVATILKSSRTFIGNTCTFDLPQSQGTS